MSGRRLGRIVVELLMETKIGNLTEWISAYLNFITADITHLKKEGAEGDFDYGNLEETYPILDPCC